MKSVQIRSFFWSAFSRIRTEYRHLVRKSPYSAKYRKMRTRKKSLFGHFLRSNHVQNVNSVQTNSFSLFCLANFIDNGSL